MMVKYVAIELVLLQKALANFSEKIFMRRTPLQLDFQPLEF